MQLGRPSVDNPYSTLGVPHDASPDDIKQAWRRQASAAHPDRQGGDASRMQALSVAYDVLSNPAKRAHYDKTGSTQAAPSIDEKAHSWLRQLLMGLITGELEMDVIAQMVAAAVQKRQEIAAGRDQAVKMQERLKRRLKKLKGPPDNFLAHTIISTIAELEEKFRQFDEDAKVCERAIELLADFSYEAEQAPAVWHQTAVWR
jgi:hypothetical protein